MSHAELWNKEKKVLPPPPPITFPYATQEKTARLPRCGPAPCPLAESETEETPWSPIAFPCLALLCPAHQPRPSDLLPATYLVDMAEGWRAALRTGDETQARRVSASGICQGGWAPGGSGAEKARPVLFRRARARNLNTTAGRRGWTDGSGTTLGTIDGAWLTG